VEAQTGLHARLRTSFWPTAIPWTLGAALALASGTLAVLAYRAMTQNTIDLAGYDQILWTTLHGQILRTTVWIFPENDLGFQVSPILALLAPLALVFHDGSLLMMVQRVGLALAVVPIAWWARHRLGNPLAVFAISLAWVLNPVVWWSNDHPFHQITLAAPLLGFALYFQLRRNWKAFWPCLLLALSVKEEVAFLVIGMGIFALLQQRQPRQGVAVIVLGLVWAAVSLEVIIPYFNGPQRAYFISTYAYLGSSASEIAWNAITQPGLVISHIATADKLYYVYFLLIPLGLLPLLGWRVAALALPTLGYLFLGMDARWNPHYYYGSPMLPFLFFGAIEGMLVLKRFVRGPAPSLLVGVAAVASYFLLGPGPGTKEFFPQTYQASARNGEVQATLDHLPAEASVSATNNVISHVARRMTLHHFPEVLVPSDIFVVDLKGWGGWQPYPGSFNDYDQALRRVLHDPELTPEYQPDGLLLLRQGQPPPAPSNPLAEVFGGQIELAGYDVKGDIRPNGRVTLNLYWRARSVPAAAYTVAVHFGPAGNEKLVQRDNWPWDGFYPTNEWLADRTIADPHVLILPASLPAGEYWLNVGLYSVVSNQAVPLQTASGQSSARIGPITVH
jgi:uncharacterized membrane protein